MRNKFIAFGVTTAAITTLVVTMMGGVAFAWPNPTTVVIGGTCDGNGHRSPVSWIVTNNETGYHNSPASVQNVNVAADVVSHPVFTPNSLPNTGEATATAQTVVSVVYTGPVVLEYDMVWSGRDGHDTRHGTATVNVVNCDRPVTTTTTTTTRAPSTTTTTVPVTSTTVAPTTTTTTVPTTVVTPTTKPVVVTPTTVVVIPPVVNVPEEEVSTPNAVKVQPHFNG